MRRLLPLILLPCLAACARGDAPFPFAGGIFDRAPEPEAPPPLPAAVTAALPPGVPTSVVLQDAGGCYLYSIERTEPPSGYPLRDALGNPICEGGPAPVLVADASPLPPPSAVAPEIAAPLAPAPAPPPLAPASAPLSGPVASEPILPVDPPLTPFVPGDIAPPAPLAPLD